MKSGKKDSAGKKGSSVKKTRRARAKYPGLAPDLNLKTRAHLLDYDYLDKLGPEEMDFLNRFTEEDAHSNFDHGGEEVYKDPEQRRASYSRNNSRNRDIMTLSRTKGWLVLGDTKEHLEEKQSRLSPDSTEDNLLDLIDLKDAELKKK